MGMSASAEIVFGVTVERAWDDMSDEEQEAAQEAIDDEWQPMDDKEKVRAHNQTSYDNDNDTFLVGILLANTYWDAPKEVDLRNMLGSVVDADVLLGVNAFCAKHKLTKAV